MYHFGNHGFFFFFKFTGRVYLNIQDETKLFLQNKRCDYTHPDEWYLPWSIVTSHFERQKIVKLEFQPEFSTVLEKHMNNTKRWTIWFIFRRESISHARPCEWLAHCPEHSWHYVNFVCATMILATRLSAESTGISYTKDFVCLQKRKSCVLRSGDRGGCSIFLSYTTNLVPKRIKIANILQNMMFWVKVTSH